MAREYQMQSILQMNSDVITESIFADYERPLWKEYHILGARVDCIEGEIDFKEQEIAAQSYSRAAQRFIQSPLLFRMHGACIVHP